MFKARKSAETQKIKKPDRPREMGGETPINKKSLVLSGSDFACLTSIAVRAMWANEDGGLEFHQISDVSWAVPLAARCLFGSLVPTKGASQSPWLLTPAAHTFFVRLTKTFQGIGISWHLVASRGISWHFVAFRGISWHLVQNHFWVSDTGTAWIRLEGTRVQHPFPDKPL